MTKTRYYATISHYSISRARVEDVGDDINEAKRRADEEFGGDFNDYILCIYDRQASGQDRGIYYPVASRKMDEDWDNDMDDDWDDDRDNDEDCDND